jgi:hypothetical protein
VVPCGPSLRLRGDGDARAGYVDDGWRRSRRQRASREKAARPETRYSVVTERFNGCYPERGIPMLRVARICMMLPLALATSPGLASADSITAGGPFTEVTCLPFGCTPNGTYQQVYAATLFPGTFSITGLDFFNTTLDTSPPDALIDPAHYEVTISTTSAMVNGLNTTDFASNLGADAQLVFSGPLGGELPPGPDATLPFNWIEPFRYNPRNGNLLVEVRKSGGIFHQPDGFVFMDATNVGKGSSSVGDFGLPNNQSFGLITRLRGEFGEQGSPTPEPASLLLVGSGICGLVARAQRRKQRPA